MKNWIRKWLGFDEEIASLREEVRNTRGDCLALEQVVDALCDHIGVDITADCVTGNGEAIVTKREG